MKVNIISNELMTYDMELHQYVLTSDAAMKYLGIDINSVYASQQVANAELIKQSMQVYDWMYSQLLPGAKANVEFLIATGDVYRDVIFKALLGQLEYAIESRGNEVPLQHGVLLSKGTVIPVEQLRGEVQVSLKTVQAITNAGLLYNGRYNWRVPVSQYRVGY